MKKKCFQISFLFCVIFIHNLQILHAGRLSRYEYSFIEKHTLPDGPTKEHATKIFSNEVIINALEQRNLAVLQQAGFTIYSTWGNIVIEHPSIKGWIIKSGKRFADGTNNIRRITNAEKVRRCITKYNLPSITVPKKYLFHIPGKGEALNNKNYLVFCEKLDLSNKNAGHLTNQQVREVCKTIRYVGMCDTRTDNIRLLTNEKIAFIDTEPFFEPNTWWWDALEHLGIRSLKGAIGSHIFRQCVAKDRRRNRLNGIQ